MKELILRKILVSIFVHQEYYFTKKRGESNGKND